MGVCPAAARRFVFSCLCVFEKRLKFCCKSPDQMATALRLPSFSPGLMGEFLSMRYVSTRNVARCPKISSLAAYSSGTFVQSSPHLVARADVYH